MNNNNISETKKYDGKYDILKFVLSLMVLAIHTALYPMILYPWLRIAVPLFFIMSSYFFFSKINISSVTQQKNVLKKYVIRNIQLYLCWFIICLPVTLYVRKELFFSNGFLKNVLIILRTILFGDTFVASWFISASIIGVVIIYFLNRWLKNDYLLFFICLFVFCIVTLQSSYSSIINGTIISTVIKKYIDIFGGLVCSFPASLFWIFIGKIMAEHKIKFKSTPLLICLIICSCIGLFYEWKFAMSLDGSFNNDSYFMLAPLCVLLFIGVQKIKPIYWKYSVYVKRASTIIYVSHGSVSRIISKIVSILLGEKNVLITYLLTILCCIVIYAIIEFAYTKFSNRRIAKVLRMLY